MQPTPLGFFAEFKYPAADTAPSLREAVGRGPGGADQRRLAFYLVGGSMIAATPGGENDVLDDEPVYLTASPATDGDWFWRRDLAHYVAKYNIALPDEFLEHARAHQWAPGEPSEARLAIAAEAFAAFVMG